MPELDGSMLKKKSFLGGFSFYRILNTRKYRSNTERKRRTNLSATSNTHCSDTVSPKGVLFAAKDAEFYLLLRSNHVYKNISQKNF